MSDDLLGEKLREGRDLIRSIRNQATSRKEMFASDTSVEEVVSLHRQLRRVVERLTAIKQFPGMGAYAKDQFGDQALDWIARANNTIAACNACAAEIEARLPANGNGWLQVVKFTVGKLDYRTITAAQLSSILPLLDDVITATESKA